MVPYLTGDQTASVGPGAVRYAASLLEQTLQEEKKTDALLSKLAEEKVNLKAA